MITLKRLQAENFKGLRSVDLIFPERGSVLIEGHNEAGKSTLFEAVYVALYGKPLVGEDNQARQEEVIQHGQSQAIIQLTFRVGQQELTVTRIIERGKSQQVKLTIQRPGLQQEVVNRVRAVDERILKELGNLDGESLRNSCFVEQKELGRIEALSPAKREEAVQKLLGLERLSRLVEQFKFKREQERELTLAGSYLKLAQVQAEVCQASAQEAEVAERLDAVKVSSQMKHLTDMEAQRGEAEERLREWTLRAQKARERLERCSTLREQMTRCDQANQQIAEVHHAHEALHRVEEELARLESIERVEFPAALLRLSEVRMAATAVALTEQARKGVQVAEEAVREAQRHLKELEQAEAEQQRMGEGFSQAQVRVVQRQEEAKAEQRRITQRLEELDTKKAHLECTLSLVRQWEAAYEQLRTIRWDISAIEAKEQELARLQLEMQRRESEARVIETDVARAEQELQRAAGYVRLARGFEALGAWVRLKGVERTLSGYTANYSGLVARRKEAEMALATARMKMRMPLSAGITLAVLTLLALVLGVLWYPAFALFVFMGGGAIIAWIWFFRTRKVVQQQSDYLAQCNMDFQRLEMQHQAAIQAGGDPATLGQYEQQLQVADIAVPPSLDAGRTLQEELRQRFGAIQVQGYHALQGAAQEAQANYVLLTEQFRQARSAVEESKSALQLAQQSGDPAQQLRSLKARAAEQERIVATAEQKVRESLPADVEWPTNSNSLQTVLSTCRGELRSVREAQEQQELLTARLIKEAEADRAKAEHRLQRVQEITAAQRAIDPAGKLFNARENLAKAEVICRRQVEATQPLLQRIKLNFETEVEPERGRAEAKVQALKEQLISRPLQQEKCKTLKATFADVLTAASSMIRDLLATSNFLAITGLPPLPHMSDDADAVLSYEQTLTTTLNEIKNALEATLVTLDEQGATNILHRALGEQGTIVHQKDIFEGDMKKSQQAINEILSSRNIAHPPEFTHASIAKCWPLTAVVLPDEESQVMENLDRIRKDLYATQQQKKQLATDLHHPGTPLSIEEWAQKVAELIEERQICELATKLLGEAQDRIARRVLPITERNMQPLLQQLTGGRYGDVRLTPEDSNGQPVAMDYRIRVWDHAARRYVAKNLFSGGTRDQCSLALRLAFALATLPQELGVAPGFIFLDEPLSAFDAQRAQALVELLTTGTIAQQFNQVVLISHYHAFDREVFQYHIHMENGQVIETDLPGPEAIDVELTQLQAVRTGSKQMA